MVSRPEKAKALQEDQATPLLNYVTKSDVSFVQSRMPHCESLRIMFASVPPSGVYIKLYRGITIN